MLGPSPGDRNDAEIVKDCVDDHSGLAGFLKAGDVSVVDRGFRNEKGYLESKSYVIYMPALEKGKQLTAEEANKYRFVTEIRWGLETVHGIIKQKY